MGFQSSSHLDAESVGFALYDYLCVRRRCEPEWREQHEHDADGDAIAGGLSGTRVYDGTTVAVGSGLTIVNNVDGGNLTLSGNGVLAAADVGSEAISTAALPSLCKMDWKRRSQRGNDFHCWSGQCSNHRQHPDCSDLDPRRV